MKNLVKVLLILVTPLIILPIESNGQHTRRFVAEWEPAHGTLIRWPLGIPSGLVVELAKDDSLYLLVASNYHRDQAINTFSSWNVNLDHCRFVIAPTNSHWTRDWGPHYVFDEQGVGGIADPYFDGYPWVPGCNVDAAQGKIFQSNRSKETLYELDNLINGILAQNFACPLTSLPIYLTGGNIMADGRSTAVATQQMLDENYPGFTEQQFRQIAEESLGITNFIIVDNPEVNGIQHIDCYAKFLNERTILVKEVDTWNWEYACCEALAEHLGSELNCYGEPYQIERIYCGSYNGNEVAAYTNSLILNKKVLVPLFGISSDAEALETYERTMPGYEVIGFDWSAWYYYDALHCRTMGIFDRQMLRIEHKPLDGIVTFEGIPEFEALIDDRSEAGLLGDELLLYWRQQGDELWYEEIFIPMAAADSFYTVIPTPTSGTTYEYYLSAKDNTGRHETLPRTAPDGFYSFTYEDVTAIEKFIAQQMTLTVQPSVFSGSTNIIIQNHSNNSNLSIWSLSGDKIRNWKLNGNSQQTITWDGCNPKGVKQPQGMYIIKLETPSKTLIKKAILTSQNI
jgi:agmatine deiminase